MKKTLFVTVAIFLVILVGIFLNNPTKKEPKKEIVVAESAPKNIKITTDEENYYNEDLEKTFSTPIKEIKNTDTYYDDVYGFTVSYPQGWTVDKNIYGTLYFKKDSNVGVSMIVVPLADNSGVVTKEQYIESVVNPSYKKQTGYQSSSNIETKLLSWNDRDVLVLKETYTGAIARLGIRYEYYVLDDRAYIFNLSIKEVDQDKYKKDLNDYISIAQSIKFQPKSVIEANTPKKFVEDFESTHSWNVFSNSAHGFSFKYPQDWRVVFLGPRCDMRINSPEENVYIDVCWSKGGRFRDQNTMLPKFIIDDVIAQWYDLGVNSKDDLITLVEFANVKTLSQYSTGFWRIELHSRQPLKNEKDVLNNILSTLSFSK
ncbi:hypothetical protein EXS61_01555 [Candidatus Parcubacteria bacterium]|nr:hypothetical protein [Candidatus Parcubacteria bacterium]